MAQQLACDVCQAEPAVQMLTNIQSGDVMMLGMACLPVFYGQSLVSLVGADQHAGTAAKCPTCKVIHQLATKGVIPIGADAEPAAEPEPAADSTESTATA